jgi:acetoin utilization deacetylase AcuC-like enzyme
MLEARHRLGLVFFPAYDWAISPTHPEREERLLYTQDQIREEGVFDIEGITEYRPDVAAIEDILRVHFCFPDAERVVTPSHLVSAGGAIKAGRLVMEKKEDRAFALVRPPGHHAMKSVHGNRGFCIINIEAVMIEYIREHYGVRRVAVIDTDCHHGDGTQDVYWHDPDTLFISLHQDGRTLYPGSGFPEELGGPKALGKTINVPLPPRTSDDGFVHVIDHLVLPILKDFQPDLIVNSAGQDNHFSDPITDMAFSAQGYARLTEKLGAHVAVLEGGYSIQGALPYVNLGIVLAMAGLDYSGVREPNYNPRALKQAPRITDYIHRLTDDLLELYFHPEKHRAEGQEAGGWYTREKNIFYDTDGIRERQVESLKVCPDCRGLLKVETRSNRVPSGLGLEIPIGACPACSDLGQRILEEAAVRGQYRYMQMIHRPKKIYRHFNG